MSVILETSLGDIVIDLFVDKCPLACQNFLKLCKIKFYNNALVYDLQKEYLARFGHIGKPHTSIYQITKKQEKAYFKDEIQPDYKIKKKGLLGTANLGPHLNHSEFFLTLTDSPLTALNGKHTIFGIVAEGLEVLDKINRVYCDENNRPLVNIRIFHTLILEDPLSDISGLSTPDESPEPILKSDDRLDINQEMEILFDNQKSELEVIEDIKKHEARTREIVLETLNNIPDADIKPPENVLFVCKLNPETSEAGLEVIFSKYGEIKRCDVIRDWKTGQSLQYAFIEFEAKAACEEAYLKMENALIDERRIHVDFSQSVSKLWNRYRNKKTHQQQQLGHQQEISVRGRGTNDYQMDTRDYKHSKSKYSRERNSKSHRKRDKKRKYSRSRSKDKHRKRKRKSRKSDRKYRRRSYSSESYSDSYDSRKKTKKKSSKKHRR